MYDSYQLLCAAASHQGITLPSIDRIKLPRKEQKPKRRLPSMAEMVRILKGSSVYIPCMLSLECGGLRISEVRGLKYSDIDNTGEHYFIHVHAPRVCVDGKDVEKDRPKTEESDRRVELPAYLYEEIQCLPHDSDDEFIVKDSYKALYRRFKRLTKRYGYDMHPHDLRAIFATEAKLLKIPKDIIMQQGGWANSKVLDKVYTVISDETCIQEMQAYHQNIQLYLQESSDIKQ